jgi:tetratricopeptide (TPR) repeat protein
LARATVPYLWAVSRREAMPCAPPPCEASSAARTRSQATTKPSHSVHAMGKIHFNRGNLLQDLGRFEEALSSYAAELALAPDHVGVINNGGTALRELGRYEEALQSYDRALSIDPRSWQAHNNRGNLFTLTGRLDEAVSAFEHAIVLAARSRKPLQPWQCAAGSRAPCRGHAVL